MVGFSSHYTTRRSKMSTKGNPGLRNLGGGKTGFVLARWKRTEPEANGSLMCATTRKYGAVFRRRVKRIDDVTFLIGFRRVEKEELKGNTTFEAASIWRHTLE